MAWHHWCKCDHCGGYRPIDGSPRPLAKEEECGPEVLGEVPPGDLCTCSEAKRAKAQSA